MTERENLRNNSPEAKEKAKEALARAKALNRKVVYVDSEDSEFRRNLKKK